MNKQEELAKYMHFGEEFWKWFTKHYVNQEFIFDEDCEEVMKLAQKHGLVKRVEYNPEIHGEVGFGIKKGDEIWWWGQ